MVLATRYASELNLLVALYHHNLPGLPNVIPSPESKRPVCSMPPRVDLKCVCQCQNVTRATRQKLYWSRKFGKLDDGGPGDNNYFVLVLLLQVLHSGFILVAFLVLLLCVNLSIHWFVLECKYLLVPLAECEDLGMVLPEANGIVLDVS